MKKSLKRYLNVDEHFVMTDNIYSIPLPQTASSLWAFIRATDKNMFREQDSYPCFPKMFLSKSDVLTIRPSRINGCYASPF